jgi:hypothetical protein
MVKQTSASKVSPRVQIYVKPIDSESKANKNQENKKGKVGFAKFRQEQLKGSVLSKHLAQGFLVAVAKK